LKPVPPISPVIRMLVCALFASGALVLSVPIYATHDGQPVLPDEAGRIPGEPVTTTGHMPLAPSSPAQLCQFGVGAGTDIASYAVNELGIGWYVDWTATLDPARPGGIDYVPMIRLEQTGPDSYIYSPNGDTLLDVISANPRATWLIGNEPDRRRWQDDMEPHVYARAYHELYHLIKGADPESQVAAGGIVQPTPLRLQYLDLVLESYRDLYGEPMPVDVWNIHAFILRERSCDIYPDDCWGAEVPPGIDEPQGMLYEIQDNDSLDIFKQHIEWFRQWMADKGYQDRPLIITEFGVQMWPDLGFPPERVNAFMDGTFDYLLTATGPLGYPADGYRLVQRWAWYSLTDDSFNGWLFDPTSKARTAFGDHFATYTAALSATVNLFPVKLWHEPPVLFSPSEPVTYTLYAQVANNGNVGTSTTTIARFYEGDPGQGGVQIGSDQVIPTLGGCASSATVEVTWSNVPPGAHTAYVVVDPLNSVTEDNESDNTLSSRVLVATSRLFLPAIFRVES
jgi:hypothetical protein